MPSVFRLHKSGVDSILGWGNSNQYNSNIIHSIMDPAGATSSKEITSIPSPFARMDLVREAFAFVNRTGIDGDTIHHKMVSHAIDIAQIFFNFNNFKESGLIDIIKWDKSEIQNLINSNNPRHALLGQSYDLFLNADSRQFNFDDMNGLYMLRYIGPNAPNQFTIIGSTSPASLFYTSANSHPYLRGKIIFGNHQALDDSDFLSLKDRHDEDFIAWFYALKNAIPNFSVRFPDIDKYLNLNFGLLSHTLQNRINAMDDRTFQSEFLPLEVQAGIPVEILGTQLTINGPIDISKNSDFAIQSLKVGENRPLVLPSDTFARPWIYTTSPWTHSTEVPVNPGPIDNRILPADGTKYPYLTMTDFLEDTLIMTESCYNSEDFFDGNLNDRTGGEHSFLLPVKRTYFEYFGVEDLKRDLTIICDESPGGGLRVKVSLKIPVKKGYIAFERIYLSDSAILNPKNGTIKTEDFAIVFYPKTIFPANLNPDYVVGIISKSNDWNPRFQCFSNEAKTILPTLGPIDRNMDAAGNRVNNVVPRMPMATFDQNFEGIDISSDSLHGIAIPIWSGVAGGSVFEFAVDFGTSNTHVEYRKDGSSISNPLDIQVDHQQLALYTEDAIMDPTYILACRNTCIPINLGIEGGIQFPMRTLLSYKKSTNWSTPTAPYLTGNLHFYFGEIGQADYNDVKSNLKWSNDVHITAMIECYLSSLMVIMRNKVIMEGGDPSQTKIRWFYPTSMPAATVANISNIWARLYRKYFGDDLTNLTELPESIAPYQYYQNTYGAGIDVLTVDIGGGTSDAFIVDSNGDPAFITSFRFAANSLLGDGLISNGLANNGFVAKYRPIFDQILQANSNHALITRLNQVASTGNSADFLSMLFSLKSNSDVIAGKYQDKVDFLNMLQNSAGAKTLILIFYTAIIYHLATFIKAKREAGANVQEPAILAFSGNGSKLLQTLGVNTNVGRQMLETYTKVLFEKVNGRGYPHSKCTIVIDSEHPKESTCKGGLLASRIPDLPEIQEMTDSLLGTSPNTFINERKYKDLTSQDWDGLKSNIEDFTRIFFELAKEQKITSNFGTVSMQELEKNRKIFLQDPKLRASNALILQKLLNSSQPIEDTLFFYPVTEMLNTLAKNLL
ncbi:MAG: hypothetical protein K2M31_03370 [Muribaculaceae bacterium]|nr:hypothetical protein [Muribaculaceae bacterium]